MRKTVKQIITMIEADGWILARQKGSYKQYTHPTKKRNGNRTRPRMLEDFVVGSILKQAGLK